MVAVLRENGKSWERLLTSESRGVKLRQIFFFTLNEAYNEKFFLSLHNSFKGEIKSRENFLNYSI